MSKSKGNVVTVDMVMFGVCDISPQFEFRDVFNRPIPDYKRFGIWQDKHGDGMFYCSSLLNSLAKTMWPKGPFRHMPVFLCKKDEIVPPRLARNGAEVMQHRDLLEFWDAMHELFPDEFEDTGETHFRAYYTRQPTDYEKAGVYSKLG